MVLTASFVGINPRPTVKTLFKVLSRWRPQPKRGCRWPLSGLSQRTRASRNFLQNTINVNVNAMKAHPCASMAFISSMKWITHQLLIFRAWWRGKGVKREIGVWSWQDARPDPRHSASITQFPSNHNWCEHKRRVIAIHGEVTALISSMKLITHQLLIFRAWWRGRVLNVRLVFGLGKMQDLTLRTLDIVLLIEPDRAS
jgi:hypothetical protein